MGECEVLHSLGRNVKDLCRVANDSGLYKRPRARRSRPTVTGSSAPARVGPAPATTHRDDRSMASASIAARATCARSPRARASPRARVVALARGADETGRREWVTRIVIALGTLGAADRASAGTYKRSFRERFETSISSATHDYSFSFPDDWGPDIVSLNDGKLYGVDTRYKSESGNGQLAVSVLPFVGADSIDGAGTPEVVLTRFEELIGAYWEQNGFGKPGREPAQSSTVKKNGVVYYKYELTNPHNLISACVVDGELYLMVASCSARSWKSTETDLRSIVDSFEVPP